MRPHKLILESFGPFSKRTEIDFDQMGNHVFLITGEIGSGKTMIFDGIVYALYGVASGSSRNTKTLSTENFHSDYSKHDKQKDEMKVELSFSNAGKEYIVKRTISWGKKGTNINSIKESSLEEIGGPTIYDKGVEFKDHVTQKIIQILGLDANQFRQIIMLAQGEFEKFLSSDSDKREEILKMIHDNRCQEDYQLRLKAAAENIAKRLDELAIQGKTHIGSFFLPETGEREETVELNFNDPALLEKMDAANEQFNEKIKKLNSTKVDIQKESEKLIGEKEQGKTHNQFLDKLDKERENQKKLAVRIAENVPKKKSLVLAASARNVIPSEMAAEETKKEYQHIIKSIENLTAEKERLAVEEEKLKTNAEKIKNTNTLLIDRNKNNSSLLKSKLGYYDALSAADKEYHAMDSTYKNALKNLQTAEGRLEKNKEELEKTKKELSLLENAGDLAVAEKVRLLNQQKERLTELEKLDKDVNTFMSAASDLEKTRISFEKAKQTAHAANDRYYSLNKAYLGGQAGILAENMRRELSEKTVVSCPVCGAEHHAEDMDSFAKLCEGVPSETVVEDARKELDSARKEYDELNKQLSSKESAYHSEQSSLMERAEKLIAVTEPDVLKKSEILSAEKKNCIVGIDECEKAYQKAIDDRKRKNTLTEQLATEENDSHRLTEALSAARTSLQNAAEKLSEAKARLEEKKKHLEGCPATKTEAQAQITKYLAKANELQSEIEDAERTYKSCSETLANTEGRLKNAGEQLISTKEKAENAARLFNASVAENGFDSRDDYIQAKSPEGKVLSSDALVNWIEKTDAALRTDESDYKNCTAVIKNLEENTAGFVRTDIEALSEHIKAIQERYNMVEKEQGQLETKYHQNLQIRETIIGIQAKMKKLDKASDIVTPLAKGANGSYSFSRYVLNGFLEKIIDSANHYLNIVSDGRFMLESKVGTDGRKHTGLDFMLYDSKSETNRESAFLSGGQKFITSLSLALGLSDVAQMESSGVVHIDSMFIDEGFGSLDDVKLNTVIDVLQRISGGERQIGIISHVTKLNECFHRKFIVSIGENGSTIRTEIEA